MGSISYYTLRFRSVLSEHRLDFRVKERLLWQLDRIGSIFRFRIYFRRPDIRSEVGVGKAGVKEGVVVGKMTLGVLRVRTAFNPDKTSSLQLFGDDADPVRGALSFFRKGVYGLPTEILSISTVIPKKLVETFCLKRHVAINQRQRNRYSSGLPSLEFFL